MSAHLDNARRVKDFGGVLEADQFGPDEVPRFLAYVPAANFSPCCLLHTGGLGRSHLAPAGQALVQVGLDDARHCGEAAALGDGVKCSHASNSSESLTTTQAIRSFNLHSELLENHIMETATERRLRKLQELAAVSGGIHAIAAAAGVSAASLDQIIKGTRLPKKADGTRSARSLGDAAARAIEDAYKLGRGWFDAADAGKQSPPTVAAPGRSLLDAAHIIAQCMLTADPITRELVARILPDLALRPDAFADTLAMLARITGTPPPT